MQRTNGVLPSLEGVYNAGLLGAKTEIRFMPSMRHRRLLLWKIKNIIALPESDQHSTWSCSVPMTCCIYRWMAIICASAGMKTAVRS